MPWLYKHKHLIIICYFFPPHLMKLLLWNEKCTASTNEYELVRTRLPNDNQHDFCICKKYLRLGTCARWKIGCSLNNVKCKCRSRNHARQKRNEFFFSLLPHTKVHDSIVWLTRNTRCCRNDERKGRDRKRKHEWRKSVSISRSRSSCS